MESTDATMKTGITIDMADKRFQQVMVAAVQMPDAEEVPIENLLMDLALARKVVDAMAIFIGKVDDGSYEEAGGAMQPPDEWAMAGLWRNLYRIEHALESLGSGHGLTL